MKEKTVCSIFFKFIALVSVDIATVLMICSAWSQMNLSILPLALATAILALTVLNLSVLFFTSLLRFFGTGAASIIVAASVLYYLYTLICTGIMYPTITVWEYTLQGATAFAVYAAIMGGLITVWKSKKAALFGRSQKKIL